MTTMRILSIKQLYLVDYSIVNVHDMQYSRYLRTFENLSYTFSTTFRKIRIYFCEFSEGNW